MSSELKIIKNLPNRSSNSILELLKYFIYGQRFIPDFDPDDVYNTDEFVIRSDPSTGELYIYVCKEDNVTGRWEESQWEPADINSVIKMLNKKIIMISVKKPDHRYNRLWVQPIDQREMNIIQPPDSFDFTNIQLIFEDEFPVVEEAEALTTSQEENLSMDPGDLLFDYEGTSAEYDSSKVYNVGDVVYLVDEVSGWLFLYTCLEDGVTGEWDDTKWKQSYSAPPEATNSILIKSQDSVDIQNNQPDGNNNVIWIDTDLSDD